MTARSTLTDEQEFAVAGWRILTDEQRALALLRLDPLVMRSSAIDPADKARSLLLSFSPKPKPEREQVYEMLLAFFADDAEKASVWLEAQNPLLGGMTPKELLDARPGKLLQIVRQQLEENKR